MTKAHAKKTESAERVDKACKMLAMKVPSSDIVLTLSTEYKITVQQARTYVRKARKLLSEAFDLDDIRWMFISSMECLQEDRLDAKGAGNHAAQVGASKAMVDLLKQLPNIDPMGCWNAEIQSEFDGFVKDRLAPPKGKIPRERIMKNLMDKDLPDIPIPDQNSVDLDEIPF